MELEEIMIRNKLRDFAKPSRFDMQDPGKTMAKVLPGVTEEQAQAMVKRWFELWPESARYFKQRVRR